MHLEERKGQKASALCNMKNSCKIENLKENYCAKVMTSCEND